eukprot:3253691-Rhodomonas_salina.3
MSIRPRNESEIRIVHQSRLLPSGSLHGCKSASAGWHWRREAGIYKGQGEIFHGHNKYTPLTPETQQKDYLFLKLLQTQTSLTVTRISASRK